MENMELAKTGSKLGFGMMRMPMKDGQIDLEQVCKMVDAYLAAGFFHFDTAWGYHNGKSEETLRKAVIERHPREKVVVATKMPIWAVEKQEDVQWIFDTQLERTGAGYFDYYLIHAIDKGKVEKLTQYGVWDFVAEQKRKGLVKHMGFSFHDKAALLDEILAAHPEVEFVQLQLNYADWEDDDVQARACYEACMKRGVAVIVMEPVKGGSLAMLPEAARAVFKAARPEASIASWAMRYCGSLEGVISVLSGMSDEAQMVDNIATMKNFEPFADADRDALAKVQQIMAEVPTIPCTGCKYCVEDCPMKINIPQMLNIYNEMLIYNNRDGQRGAYQTWCNPKASVCIECGACEGRCPQHIEIIARLKDCVAAFED